MTSIIVEYPAPPYSHVRLRRGWIFSGLIIDYGRADPRGFDAWFSEYYSYKTNPELRALRKGWRFNREAVTDFAKQLNVPLAED